MCLTNKIVIGLIFVCSLPFVYFGSRALKTHKAWRENAIAFDKAIAQREQTIDEITNGKADGTPGVRQTKLAVDKFLNRRSRAWFNATLVREQMRADATGAAVTTDLAPPKDAVGKHLYVFENSPNGAYLGEFTVQGTAGKQWQLQPTYTMTPTETARYRDSSAKWSLYEAMPSEDPELNADLELAAKQAAESGGKPQVEPLAPRVRKDPLVELKPDEMKPQTAEDKALVAKLWKESRLKSARTAEEKQAISKATEAELAEAGEKAMRKAADRVLKEVNQLDDYEQSFTAWHADQAVMEELIASANADLETVKAAVAEAEREVTTARKWVEDRKEDLKRATQQRQEVAEHCQALERTCEALEKDSHDLALKTRRNVVELGRIQAEILRLIDERTKKMAGAGRGIGA